MPLELSMWRIDNDLSRVEPTGLNFEDRLEDFLARDISIASPDWMVIGRQVPTPWKKKIDLLCLNSSGDLVVLELKRDKTEREVVAQVLDYGSYVHDIKPDELPRLYAKYQEEFFKGQPKSLEEAFCERFGVKQLPEDLNSEHQLVIVAATLDEATERIVTYLAEVHGVDINAIFFRVFKDGDREYLTRAWLRDPAVADDVGTRTSVAPDKVEWNGEYYVNFGEGDHRSWEDARKYGFVSAGYGLRLRQAMSRLEPGNRIWVNVPGHGYVGVGNVTDRAVSVDQFLVKNDKGQTIPILQAQLTSLDMGHSSGDLDNMEWLVRVTWLKTVPLAGSVRERGFFGNQNCVVEPRDKKWPFTIDRLKQHFDVRD